MTHHAGKAGKVLLLCAAMTGLLAAATAVSAADLAVGVGCTTGSDLRMRAEASTASSVVTTLNKDTPLAILGKQDGWYHVSYAGSAGYVSADFIVEDQDGLFTTYGRVNAEGVNVRSAPATDAAVAVTLNQGAVATVSAFFDGWYTVATESGVSGYVRSDFLDLTASDGGGGGGNASGAVDVARQYLGTRYVYGGASPGGFDCSGFTMYVYQQLGVSLPHSATSQWKSGKGEQITSSSSLEAGDLVFFCDPSRSNGKACSHAGIYIGGGDFIHASSSNSGGVIVSNLNSGYYHTYFVGGLRV